MVFLCKTAGVVRFFEHFCAADFYRRGFCRGFCVRIVLDFWVGAVGFLVMGAQRARGFFFDMRERRHGAGGNASRSLSRSPLHAEGPFGLGEGWGFAAAF